MSRFVPRDDISNRQRPFAERKTIDGDAGRGCLEGVIRVVKRGFLLNSCEITLHQVIPKKKKVGSI